jgi:hypothetical protein
MSESPYSIVEPLYNGNVHFDGEIITVFCQTHNREYTAKLADCRWFVGSQTWVTIPNRHHFLGTGTGEALLIVFPDSVRTPEFRSGKRGRTVHPEGPAIAAVGLSVETRFQWEQEIERLNVAKDVDRELSAPPLSQTFWTFWSLATLAVSWFSCMWIGRATHHLLTQWNIPTDIAVGIAFSLFMPGVIYMFLFLVVIPNFWRTQPTTYQTARGLFAQLQFVVRLCAAHFFIIGSIWSVIGVMNDWTVRSAIIATTFCVVMCVVLIAVYWRLLAEPHKDTAEQKPE